MSGRYTSGTNDTGLVSDGDLYFTGVDMRNEVDLLTPGMCSEAYNKIFNEGRADTRFGFSTREWARLGGASFPWEFPIDFNEGVGFGKVWGVGVFSDPFRYKYAIIALSNISYQITPNNLPHPIRYPDGMTIDAPVNFTQAFNVLLMFRGEAEDKLPLYLSVTQDFTAPMIWELVPDETNEDYTSTIPNADRGIEHGSRVWVHYDRDVVAFSDILSYTRYDADLSTIWVNHGDSDRVTCLFPSGQSAIIAFKESSVYAIENVLPSPSSTSTTSVLTTQHGTASPDTVAQIGKDIYFLSDDGCYTITQVLDNELQAGSEPLSSPLEPIIKRINAAYVHLAQGIYHDQKYFLAIPIDSATYNNAIIALDLVSGLWIGLWQFEWMDVLRFFRLPIDGKEQLFFVTGDSLGTANAGIVFALGEGFTDERFNEKRHIRNYIVTRGFIAGNSDEKQWLDFEARIATWYGAGRITNIREGSNEREVSAVFNKDRTRYAVHGRGRYDQFLNPHHEDPYREDYSVVTGGIAFPLSFPVTFNQLHLEREINNPALDFPIDFPIDWTVAVGSQIDFHQVSLEMGKTRQMGRHIQLKIEGTRGRVNVHHAAVRGKLRSVAARTRV